jgi:uncharacterized alkaline shock family protein YloU
MSESKEYITKTQDFGSVNIAEDVVASIAALAILDVEGICGLTSDLSSVPADTIAKKVLTKGIHVDMSDDTIKLDCCVVLTYGYPVIETASAVQDKVASAVEGMTGVPVSAVNVSVCGVSLGK